MQEKGIIRIESMPCRCRPLRLRECPLNLYTDMHALWWKNAYSDPSLSLTPASDCSPSLIRQLAIPSVSLTSKLPFYAKLHGVVVSLSFYRVVGFFCNLAHTIVPISFSAKTKGEARIYTCISQFGMTLLHQVKQLRNL